MRVSLVLAALCSVVLALPDGGQFRVQDPAHLDFGYDGAQVTFGGVPEHQHVMHDSPPILFHGHHCSEDDEDENDFDFELQRKETKTIYETLAGNKHFTRLVRILDFEGEIKETLDNTDIGVTFFAPTNKALTPPRRRHRHHKDIQTFIGTLDLRERLAALSDILDDDDDDDDDDKKEKRKKILKFIAHQVLSYHILPSSFSASQLAENTTFPTTLKATNGSFADQDRRIKVDSRGLLKKRLSINLYARVVWSDVQATNGVIHVLNAPLFPAPAIFQEAFAIPPFSILSSALQKVGLADSVDYHFVPGKEGKKGSFEGSGPAVTFFAPSNRAFLRLPPRLRLFLFSPFGERALKKLLEFHVVPDLLIHSDWVYNVTSGSEIVIPGIEEPELTDEEAAQYEDLVPPQQMDEYQEYMYNEQVEAGTWVETMEWAEIAEEYPPEMSMPPHEPHAPQDPPRGPKPGPPPRRPQPGPPHEPHWGPPPPPPPHHGPYPPPPPPPPPYHGPYPPPPPPPPPPPHHGPYPGPPPPPSHRGPYPGPPPPGHEPYPGPPRGPRPGPRPGPPRGPPRGPRPGPPRRPGPPPKGPHRRPHPPPRRPFPKPEPVYNFTLNVPTLLTNHTLPLKLLKVKFTIPFPPRHHTTNYFTGVFANFQGPVRVPDGVAFNGVVHLVDKLLNPLKHHHKKPKKPEDDDGEDDISFWDEFSDPQWEDWEEWLPAWATEA